MKPLSFTVLTVVSALLLLAPIACQDEAPTATDQLEALDTPIIQGVSPQNGASAVRRNSAYTIKFDDSMDTSSVASGFHMIGGEDMLEWIDSLEHFSDAGMMDDRRWQRMMVWLDSIRCQGEFWWNQEWDSCRFLPDTLLLSNALYIVFITDEMCNSSGGHLSTGHLKYDAYMYYFSTRP